MNILLFIYLYFNGLPKTKRDVCYIQSNFGEDAIDHCLVNHTAPTCLGTISAII